jgi:hypothetical protein
MRLTSWTLVVCLPAFLAGAEISGVLVDPSGAAVPGVVVALECSGAPRREAATDEQGRYHFTDSAFRRCTLRVQTPGFRPLTVAARSDAPGRLTLELAQQNTELTVAGSITENMDTVAVERSLIEQLPVLGNDVMAALADFINAPAAGAGGSSVVVDGLEGPQRRIRAALIQEVRINQNPYSAEYSRPGRGRIEIVTRKGDPEYHGSLEFGFRDSAFDARNAFASARPEEQRREWEASLSGPLHKRSKTTFFTSFEREAADEQTLVLARLPDGEIRQNFPTPERDLEWNAGITRPAGEAGSITVRYESESGSPEYGGVGGFSLPESASLSQERDHSLLYSQRTVFSPRLLGEFQARGEYSSGRDWSVQPGVQRIVVQDAFTSGGAQVDRNTTEAGLQLSGILSWNRERHFLRGGVSLPAIDTARYRDRSNLDGVFTFATLADYVAGRPFSFAQQLGDAGYRIGQRQLGVFLQHDIRLHARSTLAYGVRYEWQNLLGRDHNNFAPRLSAAHALDRDRRIVVRGGAGIFYDRLPEDVFADVLRSDPQQSRQLLITQPGYPDPFAAGSIEAPRPASLVRLDPDLRSPYVVHWSGGVEWKAGAQSTVTITSFGAHGAKLFRSTDWNAPVAGGRPVPEIAILRVVGSDARLTSRALEIAWRGRWRKWIQGSARYTLALTRDNTSGPSWLPPDSLDLSREWSRSDEDQRHRFQILGSCEPWNAFTLGAVLSFDSGRPYGLTSGRDDNSDGRANDRPPGFGRNTEQGPGAVRFDLRLARDFALPKVADTEPKLELRLDAFNALNRVNYGLPVGNLRSPFFGQSVSARDPRRLQLSAQFSF